VENLRKNKSRLSQKFTGGRYISLFAGSFYSFSEALVGQLFIKKLVLLERFFTTFHCYKTP
jgi:hypothetical protein